MRGPFALVVALCLLAGPAAASDLYVLNSMGASPALYLVDQTDASTTLVANLSGSPQEYGDLSPRPGDATNVYAISGTGEFFPCDATARLERIDADTGTVQTFPDLDAATAGFPSGTFFFPTALAIDPNDGSSGFVAGFALTGPVCITGFVPYIVAIDVDTGAIDGPAVELDEQVDTLGFSPDGLVLYGAVNDSVNMMTKLVSVNPATGTLVDLSVPPVAGTSLEGLAFRPEDDEFFAVKGLNDDDLATMSPITGQFTGTIGSFPFAAPRGLAFLVPEPGLLAGFGAAVLLLAGLHRARRSR